MLFLYFSFFGQSNCTSNDRSASWNGITSSPIVLTCSSFQSLVNGASVVVIDSKTLMTLRTE